MTQLYTASYRAYSPDMGLPVITSLGLPRWRPEAQQWPRCWAITPTSQMFHDLEGEAFARAYRDRLARLGPPRIARNLERIARDHDAERLVLLCHEADWTRCHRHRFASWWLEATGEIVKEIGGQQMTLDASTTK